MDTPEESSTLTDSSDDSSDTLDNKSSSDTEISSKSFQGMDTPKLSWLNLSESFDDTSDKRNRGSGPSQPKKAKSSFDTDIAYTSSQGMDKPEILIEDRDIYWYKSTLALKNLQAAFVPVVETEIKSLQDKTQTDFGRQLCKEATAEDIIRTSPNMAQFRHDCHDCPGTLVLCQNLLKIIKGHTTDSVNFFEMLRGTDPQNWLKSPFEFVRLFLTEDKMKLQDFQDCDITALCSIIKRCKPLMQMFGSQIDAVREARNKTFHCSRMNISKQEMEDIVDVILDFLQHIKSLKNTDKVTKVIERIKQVKSGDIILSQRKEAIQEWLPSAKMELEHTLDVANNLQENITYVENEWTRLSPEVAASKNKGEEPKFKEKILIEKRDMYWYRSTLALKNLQAAIVPVVENEMKSLQEKTQTDFGRQLCKEATAEDIMKEKGLNQAYFKHACPGAPVSCQCLLNIIKTLTTDSVPFFEMLKGTDPQQWLKSPFEFVRLFLQDYLKFQVQDFQDCDITAFCSIIKRCKPLMQMFGSKIDEVKEARKKTFHCSRMNISKQEMEDIVDVILDILHHIKSLKNTDDVTKAIERIKLVKSGDIRLPQCKDAIQVWLPSAKSKLVHTWRVANNLKENIIYVENEWARLSQKFAATINIGEEPKVKVTFQDIEERKHLEERRKRLVSSMTSSNNSSDNRDSSSGTSQPFKDQPEKSIIHLQDETVPPSENHPPRLSDRDTLASVACKYEPANEGEISHFHFQCQTPALKVQVGPAQGCDAGTQTEWEVCLSPTLIESVHESEEEIHTDSLLDDLFDSSGDEDEDIC